MRILLVVTGLGLGGAERQVVELADCFAAQGHQVAIAYMVDVKRFLPRSSDIALFPLDCRRTPWGMVQGYRRLRACIRAWQPDVVHSHMVHANILTRLVRLSCRMPRLICTAHNTNEGGRFWMLAYRLTDRLADLSTNVSVEAVEAFERLGAVPKGRMIAVYNGIDTGVFQPDPRQRINLRRAMGVAPDARVLLALGRLVYAKGHDVLLDVFAGLAGDDPDLLLWIAGEGQDREALQAQIERLGLSGRAHLLGARDDVPALLNAADLFVLPSRFEGFGLVVAEAMACEKVVVARDAGGVAEVMGGLGFLVPLGDPDHLTGALRQALALSADAYAQIGHHSRARIVEKFGIDGVLKTWLRLYQGQHS